MEFKPIDMQQLDENDDDDNDELTSEDDDYNENTQKIEKDLW